ncbi:hypothetical protein [Chitinophaga sp. CF418]|uniref:hypothetical protein n=1 Tax=Chitinophaga sp. CF418 TaxID=1855287 RepID=UPI000918E196|nr:hypothetical protein [Chitinophaga sp. CF418]SHL87634.1 hypothetical protein SAMN05216311_1018 [Chitinophaga sp. CF418]
MITLTKYVIAMSIFILTANGCGYGDVSGTGKYSYTHTGEPLSDDGASKLDGKSNKKEIDVSKIIGKNIREIKKILGPGEVTYQATSEQVKEGITSSIHYVGNQFSLDIDYYDATSKIESMYYGPDASEVKDYKILVTASNLSENDKRYVIKPQAVLNKPGEYASIKIIPNE